jgi:uncharacterized protein YciI
MFPRSTFGPLLAFALALVTTSPTWGAPPPVPTWLGLLRLVPRLHEDAAWTDADKAAVGAHFARLKSATAQGSVVLAGRTNEAGDRTLGLVIFKAANTAAAEAYLREDPAVAAGVMTMEVRPYSIALLRDPGRVAAGDDATALSQPALDYALGWYEADAARMERAVHPDLVRREVLSGPSGLSFSSVSASQFMQSTRSGVGKTAEADRRLDIRILDRWQDLAMVRVEMTHGVEFLQIARAAEGPWRIIHVISQQRRTPELSPTAKP